jgi:hypothetical protein
MRQNNRFKYMTMIALTAIIMGCTPQQMDVTQTSTPSAAPQPTVTASPTPPPLPTMAVPVQLEEPVVEASLPNGSVIYDDTRSILVYDLQSGKKTILLSRPDLQTRLPEDRSAESYTIGRSVLLRVFFSPDFTKARISICANLDDNFRCGFREFIYDIASQSLVELPLPQGMYGVHWQWSPDGSKLAGAGWTYSGAEYVTPRFFAVNNDGSNLKELQPIKDGNWRSAWHPGGQALLPMTVISRFNTILVDGSGSYNVNIEELNRSDNMQCLSFSADYQQAAFILRNIEAQNQDKAYIARSDFEFPVNVLGYEMDARYNCALNWSPDRKFLHLHYYPAWQDAYDLTQDAPSLPNLDFVYDVEKTGALLNLPASTTICGWTPDNKLIYNQIDTQRSINRIGLFNPTDSSTLSLPNALQSTLRGCPLAWVDNLQIDLPEEAQARNACRPGNTIQDIEELSITIPYFNILEVSTTLQGETLSAIITTAASNTDLSTYLTPDIENFTNGWDVLIDIDNNLLTGDPAGVEYRLVASIVPEATGRARLLGGVLEFSNAEAAYKPIGELTLSLDANTNQLRMSGNVPGITPEARLVITSRVILSVTNSRPNVAGDVVCE